MSTLPAPGQIPRTNGPQTEVSDLSQEAKDALAQKMAARIERMDTELEILVHAVEGHGSHQRGIRHDIAMLCGDVTELRTNMLSIRDLLTEVLDRLPTGS